MGTNLLQAFQILTQFVVEAVGDDLGRLAVFDVTLPVEEPRGDFVLKGIGHDGDESLDFVLGQLARPLPHVDVGLLANKISVPPANALDGREGVHDLSSTIQVGVQHSKNVLELLRHNKRLEKEKVSFCSHEKLCRRKITNYKNCKIVT